jgi:hypothetical protein
VALNAGKKICHVSDKHLLNYFKINDKGAILYYNGGPIPFCKSGKFLIQNINAPWFILD